MITDEFMYNHHPEQVGIWFKYNGWRYKEYYDVKLYDGTVVSKCYPNGASFHSNERRVSDSDVEFLRLNNYEDSYFYSGVSKEVAVSIVLGRYDGDVVPEKQIDTEGTITYIPRLK